MSTQEQLSSLIREANEFKTFSTQNKAYEINETFDNTKLGELLIDDTVDEYEWNDLEVLFGGFQRFLSTGESDHSYLTKKDCNELSKAFDTMIKLFDKKYLKILTSGITAGDLNMLYVMGEILNKRYGKIPSKLL